MTRFVVFVLVMFSASEVAAGAAERAEAKRFFEAGQKAYGHTKYGAAIAAFEQAQRLSPHPAIIFTLAQAYRLRYVVGRDSADLIRAGELYRQYLAEAPEGRRREHAVEHLSAIEPLLSRVQATKTATTVAQPSAPTRLMVQANIDDAMVYVDDRPGVAAPLIEEVEPGRHHIRVAAEGYYPVEMTRTAAEGAIAVIDVELKAKPGTLNVFAPEGATIFIDGARHATAPLKEPLTLEEGAHRVEVIESGRLPFARTIALDRGGERTVNAQLERTGQRHVALWLFAGSGVLVAAGSISAALGFKFAADADRTARKLLIDEMALTADEITVYRSNKRRRGQARVIAASMYSVAVAGLITGGLMYLFDQPAPGVVPAIAIENDAASVGLQFNLQ